LVNLFQTFHRLKLVFNILALITRHYTSW